MNPYLPLPEIIQGSFLVLGGFGWGNFIKCSP